MHTTLTSMTKLIHMVCAMRHNTVQEMQQSTTVPQTASSYSCTPTLPRSPQHNAHCQEVTYLLLQTMPAQLQQSLHKHDTRFVDVSSCQLRAHIMPSRSTAGQANGDR